MLINCASTMRFNCDIDLPPTTWVYYLSKKIYRDKWDPDQEFEERKKSTMELYQEFGEILLSSEEIVAYVDDMFKEV